MSAAEQFQLTPETLQQIREEYWPDQMCDMFPEGPAPAVGVVMGSDSDFGIMQKATTVLDELEVSYETGIVSAHRTPTWMALYGLVAARRGLKGIIAGAGGSAHLPGDLASLTRLPVFGVAINDKFEPMSAALASMIQMPREGGPVATSGINEAGAVNAALDVAQVLALSDPALAERIEERRRSNTIRVMERHREFITEHSGHREAGTS